MSTGSTQVIVGASGITTGVEQSTAVMVHQPAGGIINSALPEYMQGLELGIEYVMEYLTPPIIKIVQGQSKQDLKGKFGESAVIASPTGVIITPSWIASGDKQSPWVQFIPVFCYPEFIMWNPMGVDKLGAIRERTTDTKSDLAKRCRMFDQAKREFQCPESPDPKHIVRCQEHINYIVLLWDHATLRETPLLFSFSRTNFKAGKEIIQEVNARKIPMSGTVFEFSVKSDNKKGFDFYNLQVRSSLNPDKTVQLVPADWLEFVKIQNAQFKEAYINNMLQASYDEEDVIIDNTGTTPNVSKF